MNEKIRELALDAGIGFTLWDDSGREMIDNYTPEERLTKFAELIVRECIEQMELVRKYRYDRVQPLENQQTIIDECQYQIKQHFGVEK